MGSDVLATFSPRWRLRASLVLAASVAMGGCAITEEMTGRVANADPEGQVGVIHLVEALNATTGVKSLVAAYGFTKTGVTPSVAKVVYGAGLPPVGEGADFRMVLLDEGGSPIVQYTIRNPRRLLVEHKGFIEEDEVYYVARFPFVARAAQVRVLDRRGKTLATTDVGPVIREFCASAKRDEDCEDLAR